MCLAGPLERAILWHKFGGLIMGHDDNHEPVNLPRDEWAFHVVPQAELGPCALWELERHRGKEQKPWLALSTKEKARRFFNRASFFQEVSYEVGHYMTEWIRKESGQKDIPIKIVSFLIDSRADKGHLLKHFRFWLDAFTESSTAKATRRALVPPKVHWRSVLTHLVIYRTTEAGLTRKTALRETAELWKAWKLDQATSGITSASHWSRARTKAKRWKAGKLPLA
jgi:hypothetical protein